MTTRSIALGAVLALCGAAVAAPSTHSKPPSNKPVVKKTAPDLPTMRKGTITRRSVAIGRWDSPIEFSGKVDGVAMTAPALVYLPAGYDDTGARKVPLVVVLHGWSHTPEELRDKADLEILADRHGFVLVLPAMGKSIYESGYFPETKQRWGKIPGARWIGEVVLPSVRARYAVAGDRAQTAIIGYSTGGRGAIAVAQRYAEVAFAGSLSGTFDLMRLSPKDGEYKIHAAVLGPRRKAEERWRGESSAEPASAEKLAKVTLYLGHGAKDPVVGIDQLDALVEVLPSAAKDAATIVREPDGAHDWAYWNTQWPAMFEAMAQTFAGDSARPRRRSSAPR